MPGKVILSNFVITRTFSNSWEGPSGVVYESIFLFYSISTSTEYSSLGLGEALGGYNGRPKSSNLNKKFSKKLD